MTCRYFVMLSDIVYIGTINTNHVELSIKMLQSGKHVLCEKPMALNYKQAVQVLEVAKKSKKLFIEVGTLAVK